MAPSRQVTIEFVNLARYRMRNPCAYLYSGFCVTPLSPYIDSSKNGRAVFAKYDHSMWGSAGVVTYDLLNKSSDECDGKMAVMFSNPNNFVSYSNWFAVGVFDPDTNCDHYLFQEMYYGKETGFVRGKAKDLDLTYKSEAVAISATMSDSYKPVIKVKVSDY